MGVVGQSERDACRGVVVPQRGTKSGGMLADYNRALHMVIALEVADEEVVRRLSGRRICEGAIVFG